MKKQTEVFWDRELECGYDFTSDGTKFLFDMCDAELVKSRGWHLSKRGYVAGKEKRRERPLHKLILLVDSSFDVDHISRNKLDNRRSNLRVCSHHENSLNQKKRQTNSTGYIGVSFLKCAGKFESYVHYDGKKHYLGLFVSAEEAAKARDAAAVKLFGEYCNLNFPGKVAV